MACQTIIRYFVFGMTVHAPFHGHFNPWLGGRFFASGDISMTILTIHLSQHHMAPVGKEDMIRLFVYPSPGDLLPPFLKLPDLFLFRIFCNGLLMTLQTGGYVRQSGKSLGFEIAVACVTPQSLVDMLFMIERDRLLGLGAKTEADK
jgi:hypothetical protein